MFSKRNTLLIMITGVMVAMIAIWILKITEGQLPYVDQWTRSLVPRLKNTALFDFFRMVTELGSSSFLIPFTIVMALVLWGMNSWMAAIIFGGGTLFTHFLNQFIKKMIERERPMVWEDVNAEGFSFPSGHAMIPIVCYGLLAYYIGGKTTSPKLRLFVHGLFILLILLIGLSRYVINVHYLTDIVTGFVIGGVCLKLLIALDKMIARKTQS